MPRLWSIQHPHRYLLTAALSAVVALRTGAASADQGFTDVRPAPGAALAARVAGRDVSTAPGVKPVLNVEGSFIRTVADGKCVLYIDGDVVRNEPGGLRLAFLDGQSLRRAPGGALLLYFDGKEIRTAPGAAPLLVLDGDPLTKQQRMALVYLWRPQLLQLTDVERIAAEAERQQAITAAYEAERAQHLGTFQLRGSSVPQLAKGSLVITGTGEYLNVAFDFGNNQRWTGVAMRQQVGERQELWLAASPAGSVALGIYGVDDGAMKSYWMPTAAVTKGDAVCGRESLTGSPDFKGLYDITSANHMQGGGAYSGKLTLTPFKCEMAGAGLNPIMLSWSVVGRTMSGIATQVDDCNGRPLLGAATSTEKLFFVGRLKDTPALGLHIEFAANNRTCGNILLTKTAPATNSATTVGFQRR